MAYEQKQVFLVELDAVLDTRLATVNRLNPELAAKLVADDRYYTRTVDDFEELVGLSKATFDQAYQERDAETLKHSMITTVTGLLNVAVSSLEVEARTGPRVGEILIELNLWPYVLDADTRQTLAKALRLRCGFVSPVEPVWYPPETLTPQVCRSKYSGMIFYHLNGWIGCHGEALKDTKFPRVTVMAPELFHTQALTPAMCDEDPDLKNLKQISPFRLTELAYTEVMALELLPAEVFSIIRSDRL